MSLPTKMRIRCKTFTRPVDAGVNQLKYIQVTGLEDENLSKEKQIIELQTKSQVWKDYYF